MKVQMLTHRTHTVMCRDPKTVQFTGKRKTEDESRVDKNEHKCSKSKRDLNGPYTNSLI